MDIPLKSAYLHALGITVTIQLALDQTPKLFMNSISI